MNAESSFKGVKGTVAKIARGGLQDCGPQRERPQQRTRKDADVPKRTPAGRSPAGV